MKAHPKILDRPSDAADRLAADLSFSDARKRSLQRTVQALFRERLLCPEHLIAEGSISWLPLWTQQGLLRFEGLHIGRIGNCSLSGSIAFYRTGERPQPILSSSALLACIASSISRCASSEDVQRLIRELDNSVDNDALCLNFRKTWKADLLASVMPGAEGFIPALRHSPLPNPGLLLEQWGTLGHPWHPMYKTKLGLSTEEVVSLSPEFSPTLRVPVAALRADKGGLSFARDGGDYPAWFARKFGYVWSRWEHALKELGHDPAEWLPVPMHPYQAQKTIPTQFAAELASGDLVMLPEVWMPASPTMSFRTVVPDGSAALPHVKLPVALRLTSVQRTVSPKSAVMGPRITRLLTTIIAREQGFGGTLEIVPESVGLHYVDPDNNDDRARHLSVLFRGNPMSKATRTLFPVPVGALFADSPVDGRPLVVDLVTSAYSDSAEGALEFFERYMAIVATACLSAYLLYGIAFEAHQQNSFIMVDENMKPARLLVRDFGDLRVHAPTLRRAGLELIPYREGHSVFNCDATVRDKLLHAVMLCHMAELGLLLAQTYKLPEAMMWAIMRRTIDNAFDALRPRTAPDRWNAERHALLEADWPAKSFLRMRLTNTSDDVHGHFPNPLIAPTSP